jgi:hypothetical protein
MSALAGRPDEAEQLCPTGSSRFRRLQNNCGFIRRRFASGCGRASSEAVLSAVEKAATASQQAKSSVFSHPMTSRPLSKPHHRALHNHHGVAARDAGQFRLGRGAGQSPAIKQWPRRSAYRFQSGAWRPPRWGAFTARRAQPIRRVGELDASPLARFSGSPKARLAAKEETRHAPRSLLALNAPGPRAERPVHGSTARNAEFVASRRGAPRTRKRLSSLTSRPRVRVLPGVPLTRTARLYIAAARIRVVLRRFEGCTRSDCLVQRQNYETGLLAAATRRPRRRKWRRGTDQVGPRVRGAQPRFKQTDAPAGSCRSENLRGDSTAAETHASPVNLADAERHFSRAISEASCSIR